MAGTPRRSRPSHTTVVAYLALFMALGGSSYAALHVGSREIADNSVRSKDIRNATVRGRDVRKDTLTGADVNEGSLATVPTAARALSVGDDSITGANVRANSLTGADIVESQLGEVPLATSARSARDVEDGVVTGAKVVDDALTGDDIDESSLANVDAASLGGLAPSSYVRAYSFGTIAHPFSFNIPTFGQLTTECGAANTEWHYLNNTGLGQDVFMDVGLGDAVYRQLGNGGTLDSGNNGAADTAGELIVWQTFRATVITTSVRKTTPTPSCRMEGIAYIRGG